MHIKVRGFYEEAKEDDIYLKFGHLNNSDIFFGQIDWQTDRPTAESLIYSEICLDYTTLNCLVSNIKRLRNIFDNMDPVGVFPSLCCKDL